MKFFAVVLLACSLPACRFDDVRTLKEDDRFFEHYTRVLFVQADMPEEQYSFEDDGIVNLSNTKWQTEMQHSEVEELLGIMQTPECFEKEGECGTYCDEMAFVFFNGEEVIKVIGIGCSQSYFSGGPENWPSNNGSIKDPCDSERYGVLLEKLWKRAPEE